MSRCLYWLGDWSIDAGGGRATFGCVGVLRRIKDWMGRSSDGPAQFDPGIALDLVQRIGWCYVDFLAERYGPDPGRWSPRSMRRNYARYQGIPTSNEGRAILRITRPGRSGPAPMGALWELPRGAGLALVYRGTASDSEWLQDMRLSQTPYAGDAQTKSFIHEGFSRIYSELSPTPSEIAAQLKGHGPIYLAGHSLGGVLALLAALELGRSPGNASRLRLYSFGAPRPGNEAFASLARDRLPAHFRVANFFDPIVDLPRKDTNLLVARYVYAHCGEPRAVYSLSQAGEPGITTLLRRSSDILDLIRAHGRPDLLYGHQLRAYEHALQKELPLPAHAGLLERMR